LVFFKWSPTYKMNNNLLILIIVLIVFPLIIGLLLNDICFSYTKIILLMCLPLGVGLFYLQMFYYEQRHTNWHVSIQEKLKLKYMYIFTFFEYVAVYICIFRM